MKNYFVRVTIIDGEYEKNSSFLIGTNSKNQKKIELFALSCEAHNNLDIDDEGNIWDDHMILEVAELTEINDIELDIMRKYLSYMVE